MKRKEQEIFLFHFHKNIAVIFAFFDVIQAIYQGIR